VIVSTVSQNGMGKTFNVIDTGGFVLHSEDIFEKAIRHQVRLAIDEARYNVVYGGCNHWNNRPGRSAGTRTT
jgi:acetylglutamate kinase